MKKARYLAAISPGSVSETERGIEVRALAFVEGDQTPVGGRKSKKTAKHLQQYSTNSNNWLNSGREIPFFESPHDLKGSYSNEDKIGLVGQFETRPITESDIPNERFSDLIGKAGAFTKVEITRDDAVEKYKKGLIKEISVGLGDMGSGPQFFEASAVPWGAVRGAQLFGHPLMAEDADEDAGDENKPKTYALTLDGAMAEKDHYDTPGMDAARELTRHLRDVLSNIKTTTEAELLGRNRQQLMSQAIADFSTKIREALGLTALAPIPSGDTFMFNYARPLDAVMSDLKAGGAGVKDAISELAKEADITTEQFTAALTPTNAQSVEHYSLVVGAIAKKMSPATETNQLTPEIEQRFALLQGQVNQATERAQAAETKLAEQEKRQAVGDRYMALKSQAAKLNAEGKLTAHQYRSFFPENEQFSTAVERFTVAPTATVEEGKEKPQTLDEIEAQLKFAATLEPRVQVGSVAGADPIQNASTSAAEIAKTERYIQQHPTMTEEEKKTELARLRPSAA